MVSLLVVVVISFSFFDFHVDVGVGVFFGVFELIDICFPRRYSFYTEIDRLLLPQKTRRVINNK